MKKSVEEIIEDWRELMSHCPDVKHSVTYVMSKDLNTIIKYFDDVDDFARSI